MPSTNNHRSYSKRSWRELPSITSLARSGPPTGAVVCNWTTREPSRAEFCHSTRQYSPCCRGNQATGPLIKRLQQKAWAGYGTARWMLQGGDSLFECLWYQAYGAWAIGLQHSMFSAEYRVEMIEALQSFANVGTLPYLVHLHCTYSAAALGVCYGRSLSLNTSGSPELSIAVGNHRL